MKAAGIGDTRPPHVELRGGIVRRGAKVAIRWRLDDPAFSSGSAILEFSVRDAAGKVVARRRIAAVAVGECGVWSPTAMGRKAGTACAAGAWDVAGGRRRRRPRRGGRARRRAGGGRVVPGAEVPTVTGSDRGDPPTAPVWPRARSDTM